MLSNCPSKNSGLFGRCTGPPVPWTGPATLAILDPSAHWLLLLVPHSSGLLLVPAACLPEFYQFYWYFQCFSIYFFFHVLYEFWLAHGPILMDMSKFWSNSDGKIQVSVQFWWNNPSLGPVLMEKSKCWVQFWWNNPSLGPFFMEKSKCWVQFWWNNPSLGPVFDGKIQVLSPVLMEQSKFGSSFDGKIQVLSPVLMEQSKVGSGFNRKTQLLSPVLMEQSKFGSNF